MNNVDVIPSVSEIHSGKKICPGGYAWIFPKGNRIANVGVGIRKTFVKKGISPMDCLKTFVYKHEGVANRLKKGTIVEKISGIVPLGGPTQCSVKKMS